MHKVCKRSCINVGVKTVILKVSGERGITVINQLITIIFPRPETLKKLDYNFNTYLQLRFTGLYTQTPFVRNDLAQANKLCTWKINKL